MKKLLSLVLVFLILVSMCACGSDSATQESSPVVTQEAAENMAETEAVAPTEAEVWAEDLFAVESIDYEMHQDELKNFNVKIRNITDENIHNLYFRVQALDAAGDVLESWNMGSSDRLNAGQACWYYCSCNLFDGCQSVEEAAEKADSIRILSANIQTIKDDASSWVEYDFEEPPTFQVAQISLKGTAPQTDEQTTEQTAEEEAVELPVQYPIWSGESALNSGDVEIFGWTEMVLENGNIRYEVEYQATAGLDVVAFDPPDGDLYNVTREQVTSGNREVFAFEVEKSIMDQIQYITVGFWSEEAGNFWAGIEKNWYNAAVTEGEPIGEPKKLEVGSDSKVKVYSLQAQQLDNGYVRFTMEYKTSKGRGVSFFNQPDNDQFIYLMDNAATGGRDTYVVDVPKEDIDAVSEIMMKFYKPDYSDHVYAWFDAPRF